MLHKKLPYEPVRDFAPVVMLGISPSVLVASPAKGWKSVADLVAAAKARPGGDLNLASAGVGSASHMAAERLRLATNIDVWHVPFRSPVEAFTEVMSVEPLPMGVDEFARFVRDDVTGTIKLAGDINLTPTD